MSKRILVVDDDPDLVRLVQFRLAAAGYEIDTAEDGVDGLEKVAAAHPDLIVCDLMMPRMDGFAVLKTLKEEPSTANIPVILLTARDADVDVFRGWKTGASGYITKPFQLTELAEMVRRLLEV